MCLLLTGCTPCESPREVLAPVVVPCAAPRPVAPQWQAETLPLVAARPQRLRALLADLAEARGYIAEMEALLRECG